MNIRPPTDIEVTQPTGGFWRSGRIQLPRTEQRSSQGSIRQSSTSTKSTGSTIAAWRDRDVQVKVGVEYLP